MIAKSFAVTAGAIGVSVITACTAHAGPPPFPDLSGYVAANPNDYTINVPNPGLGVQPAVYFLTPDGIRCKFRDTPAVDCRGNNLPGIPPATGRPEMTNVMSTDLGLAQLDGGMAGPSGVKTLPPNHSINVDGVTCGVSGDGTTACKDPQGRGFILSHSWSGWSAHIN